MSDDRILERIANLTADQREVFLTVLVELDWTRDYFDDGEPSPGDYAADIIRKLGRDYLPGTTCSFETGDSADG
jgi:hypothetical protein